MGDHNPGPEPYHPSYEAPTTPFQRVVLPADETVMIPRPPAPAPLRPPPPPPKRGFVSMLGDIPIKVAYLTGAIVVTVLAVVLVFVLFSGDKPKNAAEIEPQSAIPAASAPASAAVTLPPVPASLPFDALPGKASKVLGTVEDKKAGITYPRLGKPWKAKSFTPFSYAQRVGKVALPHTMISSAFLPGATPKSKPTTDADYRALAARAAKWSISRQHPEGSTVTWTASQKPATGTGWVLGYQVSYLVEGKEQTSQAMVAVLDVGKPKPAMLLATIPDGGKAPAADINTLVKGLRTR